jgi:hypothetical protein
MAQKLRLRLKPEPRHDLGCFIGDQVDFRRTHRCSLE